jgi:hypothetical protein
MTKPKKEMTARKAKMLVTRLLTDQDIVYEKLTAHTTSFEALGYGKTVFVTIHGLVGPDPRLMKVREQLKGTGALLDPNM